mgnify:CR=1 FL=1
MTNYREILRLHSLGLNKTEIASSCRCARNTVAATLQRAANCGLQWPLPEEMSDAEHWAYKSIMTAAAYGWIQDAASVQPDRIVTRGEVVLLVNQIFSHY